MVITSTIEVVPILATPSADTSTTTLYSTRKETQFHTVTNTLEATMVINSTMFPGTGQDTPLVTITKTGEPTTITLTIALAHPTQIKSHYPGWVSGGSGMSSAPTRVNKNPVTAASTSDSVVARLSAKTSFDLYQTSHSKISLSVLLAKSGFMENPGPTHTPPLTSASAISGIYATSESTPELGHSETATAVLTTPNTFSTLASPISVSSSTQYSLIPQFLNTTPTAIASSVIVPTSSLAALTPVPSQCGELGDFTLNVRPYPCPFLFGANHSQFDDIPPLLIGNASVGPVGPAPVFNPYHQFDFSDGFTVVPPPTDPYLPSSGPLLLEFIPSFVLGIDGTGSNTAEVGFAGLISDGDHALTGCFTFNMYGASFGCNSTGPPCDFTFTGIHYDVATGVVTPVITQTASISSCPALFECDLTTIVLDETFVGLNGVQIKAAAAGAPLGWWMDDLELGWFNNSCSAGLCRQSAHIRK